MTPGESNQLTEVSNDIKWIIKSMEAMRIEQKENIDHVIESQNSKNRMMDDRITKNCEETEARIDCFSDRIVAVEKKQESFIPVKKFYDKAAAASLGIMITLGMTVIGLCYYINENVFKR